MHFRVKVNAGSDGDNQFYTAGAQNTKFETYFLKIDTNFLINELIILTYILYIIAMPSYSQIHIVNQGCPIVDQKGTT